MRAELAELREQMATEVRTRRLVVIDATGFERVVAETGERFGQVVVTARPAGLPDGAACTVSDRVTNVTMFAGEENLGDDAGIWLSGDGNPQSVLSAIEADGEVDATGDHYVPGTAHCASTLEFMSKDGHKQLAIGRDGLKTFEPHAWRIDVLETQPGRDPDGCRSPRIPCEA